MNDRVRTEGGEAAHPPERGERLRSRNGEPERLGWLVLSGVVVTLIGLVGDLATHATMPPGTHEELVAWGSGANLWHYAIFGGIVLTAAGAVLWSVRVRSRLAMFGGGLSVVLLMASLVLGGLVAGKEGDLGRADAAHLDGSGGGVQAGVRGGDERREGEGRNSSDQPGGLGSHDHHGEAGGPSESDGEGGSHFGKGHGKPGKVTAAEAKVLARQLAEAKRATAEFRDISQAEAQGYFQVTQFIPGLGLHLANIGISDTGFDPAKPNVLLYEPDEAGELHLAGVAYSVEKTSATPPEGFAGKSDVWHFHNNLCFLPAGTVTVTASGEECSASGGFFQAETAWLLHAWVLKENPLGVFNEFNPRLG